MPRLLSACDGYAGLGFAAFALCHFAWQAYRAHGDGALPQPGIDTEPALVAGLLLLWLPFGVFAWRALFRSRVTNTASADSEKTHALAVLERWTLVIVLVFSTLHILQIAGPLLHGAWLPSDVRPELVAALSSTWHGVPLLAAGYLCGVGGAAFFGTRQALRALDPAVSKSWSRAVVGLGVVGYLLGAYAVIRCASGVILP